MSGYLRQRPPPRRGARLEDALLAAAWEVLAEHGYQGFTYEAVAARAGTSRPVLYRRWPQREDLLLAALARAVAAHPIEVPDTGDLRDDAIALLTSANAARAALTTFISVQLADYFRDTGSSLESFRQTLSGSAGPPPFEQLVARAVARGELPDEPRPARVVSLPMDLLRHDILMTLGPVTADAIVEMIDLVWLPLLGG